MSREQMRPWEGTALCGRPTRSGRPCREREIDGLEACFHHVDDDLLAEAEEVTGLRRCRTRSGTPDACRYIAVAGTDPPACKVHGANLGSNTSKAAAGRVIQLRADTRAQELAVAQIATLLDPPPVGNPLEALLDKAAVACEWELITRRVLAELSASSWRYERSRVGEQVRAEILIHQQALAACLTVLERICRLNLDAKLTGIREATARMLEERLDAALEAAGLDIDGKARARETFRRGLKIVA